MQPTKALQETLYNEMLGRIKQTDLSVPSRIGEYFYYSRTEEGKQYSYMCRRKGSMDGAEELLLDLNALAEGHSYPRRRRLRGQRRRPLAGVFARHHRLPAVHAAREGPATGRDARASRSSGSARWCGRPTTARCSTRPRTPSRSDRTRSGGTWSAPSRATLVFEEKDELFDVSAGRSLDRQVIFIGSFARDIVASSASCAPTIRPATFRVDRAARGRATSTTPTTTTAGSTSAPTRARRTSAS